MYQRILIPIDGSETAAFGLSHAIKLAADQNAQLLLLYVLSDAYLNTILLGGIFSPELLQRIRTDSEEILASALKTAVAARISADTLLLEHPTSQIGEAIVQEAVRWRADLIVMGTHGRRGFDRAVMGSDAEYVVRHTPVPVLLLRGSEPAHT